MGKVRALLLAAVVLLGVHPAAAIEFFDGRLQIHGYYESTIRSIARDFEPADDWDLTQWYHVLNLEIEADLLQDRWGPFDLVSAFARIEGRYDCVWRRACGLFSSADAYGERSKRIPKRLGDGHRRGFGSGATMWDGDLRPFWDIEQENLGVNNRFVPPPSRKAVTIDRVDGFVTLANIAGIDGAFGTPDDPFPFYVDYLLDDDCRFGHRQTKGTVNGQGTQVLPHTMGCPIEPIGPMIDRPNPLRAGDLSPITGAGGSGALPLRPAPNRPFTAEPNFHEAQGLWIPNAELAELIRNDELDAFDQRFRQRELEWNRGASQQDEKELKELYLDMEFLDSRLWVRLGKQNIVWGKTELFRTTDQFNPVDLALASLPSLEESRIALWALRAVWSFYNVGPLDDVRFEVAMNYDQFEPTDLGRCGEPYTPLPVCDKTFGLMAHGVVGEALAGEIRPQDPWNSWKGIEVGARLEFRLDRFSIAIMDFWGYNDTPYADQLFVYSRNVDPLSGRPRELRSEGRCRTGTEPACLEPHEALTKHSVGQQRFHFICATSIGFSTLDPTACGQTVFNSQNRADPTNPLSPIVAIALTNILSGQGTQPFLPVLNGASLLETLGGFNLPNTLTQFNQFPNIYRYASLTNFMVLPPGDLNSQCFLAFGAGCPTPLVPLNMDPNDGPPALPFAPTPDGVSPWAFTGLSQFLTDQQEALLGCGPFYGTNCDLQGIDLMNAEGSALVQSWPGIEGTFFEWDTTNRRVAQPGTTGFRGGPDCTRFERGRTFILPGCRGPGDSGYNIMVDGSITGLIHPFTGQQFRSEMAALSWNALIGLVANSPAADPNNIEIDEFDPDRPFREGACSFAQPYWCSAVRGFFGITGVTRNVVRAGGNERFGRRDFFWHGGSELLLRYEKRNVLGASVDFAEDVTKSNWSVEFTWIEGLPFTNNNEFDGISPADTYNFTVSVDRPTFINFLNANRTFFFNSQWFFQYVDDYVNGFTSNGPWNILMTFSIQTGYFQDRLLPAVTFVYDVQSSSGAFLPQITYRFTENFSATFGIAAFMGRWQQQPAALTPVALPNRVGEGAYTAFVENGLSPVRERDEAFLRIRYTF